MAFTIGDVVRVGKGKVEYTVTWTPESKGMDEGYDLEVQSHNTGNLSRVSRGRLVLVKAAEDIVRDEKSETDGPLVQGPQPNPAPVAEDKQADMEREFDEQKAAEIPLTMNTSYQKAVLFALNILGKHVYTGSVSATKKAKTRRLNRRQKASRKANR